MNTTFNGGRWVVAAVATLFLTGSTVWAADTKPAASPTPTKEQREQMAKAHEQMATCLRSDQTLAACRQEMMQSCKSMGEQMCGSMMGRGAKGHQGMMHGQSTPSTSSDTKKQP